MPAPSRRVFIIVKAPNGDVREVPIGPTAVVIGRDESADIRVEDKKVSRRHAAFKLVDGEPWVEDLGSANGVKLNGKRVDKRARFSADDKVKVGGYQVTLKDFVEDTGSGQMEERSGLSASVSRPIGRDEVTPSRTAGIGVTAIKAKKGAALPDDGKSPVLIALDDPVKGQRFVLRPGENIIGRLEECDVPVLDGSVSRQHARVVFARDRISVSDLGSSNGSFVNDVRVEMAELGAGDLLRIGNIRFELELPPELARVIASAPVKTRPRARQERPSTGRPWAVAGMIVLLLAIAVLSFTVYWKWRARSAGTVLAGMEDAGTTGEVLALVADTGVVEVPPTIEPVLPVAPDAAAVVERTIEPVVPDAGTVEQPLEQPVEQVAETVTSTSPRTYSLGPVATATSPWGARDGSGLPANLPAVDERFDFDAFVSEKTAAVQSIEQEGDWTKLRAVVSELLAHDPINAEGRRIFRLVVLHETAEEAMEKAEKLIARGELARALKAYASVPDEAPEAARAKMKLEELRARAVEQELDKAERDLRSRGTWVRAHRRFHDVLDLEPENTRALEGIRTVERKMRQKNVRFAAYVPPSAPKTAVRETPEEIDQALSRHYGGDDGLARIAQLYAIGQMAKAVKKAEAVEKRSDGNKKDTARRIREALKTIQALHVRIKNEISNDPNQAWAKLVDLQRAEEAILPITVKSYLRRELEGDISEAFADAGTSLFDRGRFEEAFQRWEAGYKLDPTNTKVLAGFNKLEERAKQRANDAEVSAQRGERKACEMWKEITKITRGDSDVRKQAMERVRQVCG